MKAFILAGGFATRLWPLTEKRAKPLLPLAGKPLLTHLVERIPRGIPITISTNAAFARDFESWKTEHYSILVYCNSDPRSWNSDDELRTKPEIQILIEDTGHEDEKLGALGAVAKWIGENNISDDVLLLAGDNYVGFSLEDLTGAYRNRPLFVSKELKGFEEAKKFGVVVPGEEEKRQTAKGVATIRKVVGFEEKPSNPKSRFVSTGVYLIPADTLTVLTEYAKQHPDNVGGILKHFVEKGIRPEILITTDDWFDIGSFEAYLEATKTLVPNNVLRGKNSTDKECAFEGSVVLGNGSAVMRSTLRNTVLFENCTVEDCHLEDCIVDNGCVLKGIDLAGKMLREGTKLVR